MSFMTQGLKSHYDVLEVSFGATLEEIKRAYRRLVRAHHPDHADNSDDDVRMKEINAAFTVLSDPAARAKYDQTIDMPTDAYDPPFDDDDFDDGGFDHGGFDDNWPFSASWRVYQTPMVSEEIVDIMGIPCRVETTTMSRATCRVVFIPIVALDLLLGSAFTVLSRYDGFTITDTRGASLFGAVRLSGLLHAYDRYKREEYKRQQKQEYYRRLNEFRAERERLNGLGKPVGKLDAYILELASRIKSEFDASSWGEPRPELLLRCAATIENELKRLEGDVLDLFIQGLLSGDIEHPDMQSNGVVLSALESLAIRSDGFIEAFDEAMLESFYRSRLVGVTTLSGLLACDLRIRLEEYAPQDVQDELELAPVVVQLLSNKGLASYGIAYRHLQIDGRSVACGIVEMPFATFQRNAGGYGKPSSFPVLHGISWFIVVTIDGKPLAKGLLSDSFVRTVDKKHKARSHKGQHDDHSFGSAMFGYEGPTSPPPWFKGKHRPR